MKKTINNRRKLIIIVNGIMYLILIGIIIILLNKQNLIIGKEKQLIKEMNETEQVTNLQKQLDGLNDTQTEYANYIQTSKANLATAITNAGVTTNGDDTFETMIANVSNILSNKTSDATATASQILTGQTAWVNGSKVTGSMTNRGAWTSTPTSSGKVTIPAGYHSGSGYVDTSTVYNNGVTAGSNNSKTTVRLYAYYSTHDDNPPRDYQTIYLYVNGKSVWADNFNMYQGNGFSYDKTWTY